MTPAPWVRSSSRPLKKFDPGYLESIVADCQLDAGTDGGHILSFAATSRAAILARVPRQPFRVESVRRVRVANGEAPRVRLEGLAPVHVHSLEISGRAVRPRFDGLVRWSVEVTLGREENIAVRALDLEGDEVARTTVTAP